MAAPSFSQELDLTITDPDELAAICGGDATRGEALFQSCSACHQIGPDAVTLANGPHLQELFGREAGSVPDWIYGGALTAAGAEGMIWERETLNAFLEDASTLFPGHPEIADAQARQDLLTYLRVNTQPPPPAIGEVEVPVEVLQMEGDIAYGEWLGGECAGCHVADGGGEGVMIHGLPREYFITAMFEYRARARPNETMQLIAGRLGDEEIAALAAYFASIQ